MSLVLNIMRGVRFVDPDSFTDIHTYMNWGLLLKSTPVVTSPEPKTHYVDVPGADGALDLTTALTGKVHYKNRKITMEFIKLAGREEWSALFDVILAALNGKQMQITLDDDPDYYYTGRVTVGDPVRDKVAVILKMTAEVAPIKIEHKKFEG